MRRGILFAALVTAAGLFFWQRRAEASAVAYDPAADLQVVHDDPDYWFMNSESSPYIEGINMGSPDNNLLAFLALIRKFESDNRYNVLYGGGSFSDYSQHPRKAVPINLPGYEGKHSTAAGAYQFIYGTWNNLAQRLHLTDFSPASQDAAAIELLNEIGAIPAIHAGDFDTAMRIASSQWASLPYSPAKQNPKSIAAANEFLTRYLDSVA